MLNKLLMVGVSHRLYAFLFLLIVTVATGFGLPRVEVDTGFESLIPDSDPNKAAYDRIAAEFGSDNRSIVYVRDKELWTPEKLAALEKLHYRLEGLDFVERVDDLFTLRSVRGKGSKLYSKVFLTEAPKDQATADQAKADALYNPLIEGNFISKDGNVTAMLVSVRETHGDKNFDARVNDELNRVIGLTNSVFEEVFQVGGPRINAELRSILFEDLTTLAPLSAFVLVVAILFFLRSPFAAVVPLITSGLSIVWTIGMMGWIGMPINILCSMLPSLVIVIGSTEDTHMMAGYFHGLTNAQGNRRDFATRFMMKHMGVPLLLTVLTTGIGFASNIFSGIGLIQNFAIASTFAIFANGVVTILLVPMMLTVAGPTKSRIFKDGEDVSGLPGAFVKIFGFSNERFPRLILLFTVVLCSFFVYHASKLHVTNDPLSYFQSDQPLIKDTNKLHRDLSGMKTFFITLESEDDKAFQDPKNIARLVAIQNFLWRQRVFDSSTSLADHLSLINREFHGGDPEYFTPPNRRELVAQYLLFFHRRDLESYVSHDFKRANIVVRHNITDSHTLNTNVNELRGVVENIARGRMKTYVVGENLMINAAAESLLVSQVKSLGILLFVIFLIMSAMFTCFKGGLISLIPNLIPITLMFGIMGLLGIPLNPGTAMVAVIAIGIAIDGTIHLLSRYNELCHSSVDCKEAVNTTVREEATPMVATSISLALGFGILINSNFTVIAQFGALSAATVLFALFANLVITPIVMSRVRLVGLYHIVTMTIDKEVLKNSPLLRGMTNYQMRKAILISELHEFDEGALLVEQGTMGRSMFILLSGKVEVYRETEDGRTRLAILNAGEVFGEIGYIRETRRTAHVRALTKVKALRFDYKRLERDLKFFPNIVAKLNYNISRILGERLADIIEGQQTK